MRSTNDHYNIYWISPNRSTGLNSWQIQLSNLQKISIGAGADGVNAPQRMSIGIWGTQKIYQFNRDLKLSFLVGRTTIDTRYNYLIRWFFSFSYKKTISAAPNLFFQHQDGNFINDVGLTLSITPIKKNSLATTYWFDRQEWWFMAKKSF